MFLILLIPFFAQYDDIAFYLGSKFTELFIIERTRMSQGLGGTQQCNVAQVGFIFQVKKDVKEVR